MLRRSEIFCQHNSKDFSGKQILRVASQGKRSIILHQAEIVDIGGLNRDSEFSMLCHM